MLLTYKECESMYGSAYQVKKRVLDGKLIFLEKGIYSDKRTEPEIAVISKKYPDATFTMDSAFYYHGLTDVIPDRYHLATGRDSRKIRDARVKQRFEQDEYVNLGVKKILHNGAEIKIYSKERMLVELIRKRSFLPYDYYKELINSYRKIIGSLDLEALQDIVSVFSRSDRIMDAIQAEVF